jgi:membrane protease YdiL (CAAX protease family)
VEEEKRIRREFFILLAIYLLPAIYTSAGSVNPGLFEEPQAHLGILIQNVPRILLLLYLMEIDGGRWARRFGLEWQARRFPLEAVGIALLLLAISVLTSLLSRAAGLPGEAPFDFSSPGALAYLLSAISLLSVGYMEELFFRSYAITRLEQFGLSRTAAVLLSALLFSLGHLYQGGRGVAFALLAGIALGYLFGRMRRLHPLAVGHGIYNYLGLLFSGLT